MWQEERSWDPGFLFLLPSLPRCPPFLDAKGSVPIQVRSRLLASRFPSSTQKMGWLDAFYTEESREEPIGHPTLGESERGA